MDRYGGNKRAAGGLAELVGGRARKLERTCKRCGVLLQASHGGGRKVYCPPCAAERYDETVAANKAKYKAAKAARAMRPNEEVAPSHNAGEGNDGRG